MHGREKKQPPVRPSTKQQSKIRPELLDDYQELIHPKSYEIRQRWLQQELNASPSCSIFNAAHQECDIQRFCEIFSICIDDVSDMNVALLADEVLLFFCLWQNSDTVLGGTIDKLLAERIVMPSYPFQLRESAVRVMTVFHVMDILHTPKSFYQDTDIGASPKNRKAKNKYLESFFKILNELIKNVVSNITREVSHSGNMNVDGLEEISESYDQTSEESSESETAEIEEIKIDPKDSYLEEIINAWICLVPLISQDKLDEEFPEFYDLFDKLIQHHKNPAIKVLASEAIISLNDLNERLPIDKQYDIEIQKVVDVLYTCAKRNKTATKKQTQIWLNIAKALEADKCVVELPFLYVHDKFLGTFTKNKSEKRKHFNQNRKETFWTNWSEAMTIKYIKNVLGHQFNGLMAETHFSSKIFSMMAQKDIWHLAQQNVPLSMVYVHVKRKTPSKDSYLLNPRCKGNNDQLWTTKWWKKTNHGQKDNVKSSIRNGKFM